MLASLVLLAACSNAGDYAQNGSTVRQDATPDDSAAGESADLGGSFDAADANPDSQSSGDTSDLGDQPDELAFIERSSTSTPTPTVLSIEPLTPVLAPTGKRYSKCTVDYSEIDWTQPPSNIVEQHTVASQQPCAEETWYSETAFQNGVLVFMVLTGEEALAAAAPASDADAATATSLREQGFDQVASLEITSSGSCTTGEVQVAILRLRSDAGEPLGLEAIIDSAKSAGALVDEREAVTIIAGGGSPCTSGIVIRDDVIAWFTSNDANTVTQAATALELG